MNRKEKEYRKNLLEEHAKMMELRECGNADHLTDENGDFKSTFDIPPDAICIGKLEEAMQWVFYHKEFDHDDKLRRILKLENLVQQALGGIHYVPYWSKKLN